MLIKTRQALLEMMDDAFTQSRKECCVAIVELYYSTWDLDGASHTIVNPVMRNAILTT